MSNRPTFSLRIMFVGVAVISYVLAAVVPEPTWMTGVLMLVGLLIAPVGLGIGIVSSSRPTRACCIGALAPALIGLWLVAKVIAMHNPTQPGSTNQFMFEQLRKMAMTARPGVLILFAALSVAGFVAVLLVDKVKPAE